LTLKHLAIMVLRQSAKLATRHFSEAAIALTTMPLNTTAVIGGGWLKRRNSGLQLNNWRLSDDGPSASGGVAMGRHPKPFTRAAVAGRRMAQLVYPQLRKYPCVPALTLRASGPKGLTKI
jgi:hypothetical protein